MKPMSLSRMVVSRTSDRLITFSQAAYLTQTSVVVLERFGDLGLIEPIESMLRLSDLTRVTQIMGWRRDLGLNLVGAAIVLEWQQKLPNSKPR